MDMQITDPYTLAELKEITEKIEEQAATERIRNEKFCAFIADKEKWDKFCKKNKRKIKYSSQFCIELKNGERWQFFDSSVDTPFKPRGCRFYKAKVDTFIDKFLFQDYYLPCCLDYCIKIEWI